MLNNTHPPFYTLGLRVALVAPTGLARAHGRFSAWRAPPLAPALLRLDPPQRRDTALMRPVRSPACTRPPAPGSTLAMPIPPQSTLLQHGPRVSRPALPLRVRRGFSARRAARSPACTRPSPPESTPATLPPPRGTLPPHALRVYRPALPLRVRHGRFSARRAPPLAPALPRPNPPQRRLPHVHYLGAR
ncbi:hypothetical protein C8F04DRAFT_1294335 [Mycena alexandri]|uniref:Uncharacterized protein n=1 Tax=Mycena alexandri TaxID=1745969 RepID=A0AAD6WU74_9AGAR|nr:hypothetical protein C8F04DRAFT_1294335 [Mycena alexandri]